MNPLLQMSFSASPGYPHDGPIAQLQRVTKQLLGPWLQDRVAVETMLPYPQALRHPPGGVGWATPVFPNCSMFATSRPTSHSPLANVPLSFGNVFISSPLWRSFACIDWFMCECERPHGSKRLNASAMAGSLNEPQCEIDPHTSSGAYRSGSVPFIQPTSAKRVPHSMGVTRWRRNDGKIVHDPTVRPARCPSRNLRLPPT
jgi:hypothetical protein